MNLLHSAQNFLQRRAALIAIMFLAANHLIGVVGLSTQQRTLFEDVSWINLLLSLGVVIAFQKTLSDAGFVCTIRQTRGDDIDAACGQLANKNKLASEIPTTLKK